MPEDALSDAQKLAKDEAAKMRATGSDRTSALTYLTNAGLDEIAANKWVDLVDTLLAVCSQPNLRSVDRSALLLRAAPNR